MKHRHEKWIHLMADGVRIETNPHGEWIGAYWGNFDDNNLTFRIAPNQPADKDGWIQWLGGDNPAKGKRVDAKFKGGDCLFNLLSTNFDWKHKRSEGDITHYRIVKEKAKKWRWMYCHNRFTGTEGVYLTEHFTEEEVADWVKRFPEMSLGPRQDWTEVCDE